MTGKKNQLPRKSGESDARRKALGEALRRNLMRRKRALSLPAKSASRE